MLRLFEHDASDFTSGQTAVLGDAVNVKLTREINGNCTLSFDYPMNDEKADLLEENMIAVCEEQAYRIIKLTRSYDGRSVINAECLHIYDADSQKIHLQNVPDMIGKTPLAVMKKIFSDTQFTLFTDSELSALGMKRVDSDGFEIDFFSEDKTTPHDVMQEIIKNCGKGEIYADNYKIALVERIGSDRGLRLRLGKNMENLTVERDITDLVTRLYPYGYDDAHIGSVNDGKQYIDSDNISIYGVREGYADYSDYSDPEKIMSRAEWEFSAANAERIDVPDINISGDVIDIARLAEYGEVECAQLGDTVTVSDGRNSFVERIIKIESYPYEPKQTRLSVGRVKKDLFFYLNQMGLLSKSYKRASAGSGKVRALSISGSVIVDGISTNADGEREFSGVVDASYITLSGVKITEQDGAIYIDGKKILLEETEEE